MPIYQLPPEPIFPSPEEAEEEGLLAVGGDLSPERLVTAYSMGIFPWPHRGMPLLWFSPDPRMVLEASQIKLARSLRQVIRRAKFEVRLDTAFADVMTGCAKARRKGQRGTWISKPMIKAYCTLHDLGIAHSAESWLNGKLVGGLYGVCLGGAFFGESMFAAEPDASKVAFATLVAQLRAWGVDLVDCQTYTDHLARFGARLIPRRDFLDQLSRAVRQRSLQGRWKLEVTPEQVCST
ncbi:MAG: leucyl/phenylalanyl-tRNA--protein transferase [Planctomycetes bacterium]|nr:leucyl/phenylalanyl-tRNA--protein transferase [Planctomycetota bacterium]